MKNKAIYALYVNSQFYSWLYGAFCQFVSEPKVYDYNGTDWQTETVLGNLSYKINNMGDSSRYDFFGSFVAKDQKREQNILRELNSFQLAVFYVSKEELITVEGILELTKERGPDKLIDIPQEAQS